MISDFLLNNANPFPEVRFAPGMVTSDLQIECVDVGEGWYRNQTTINKECQWPQHFEGKTAEKIIEELADPGFLKAIWKIWNGWYCTSLVVIDAEDDNYRRHKWLDTMIDSNPASQFIVPLFYELQVSVVSLIIIQQFSPTVRRARRKH